jgi:hypothetical protein
MTSSRMIAVRHSDGAMKQMAGGAQDDYCLLPAVMDAQDAEDRLPVPVSDGDWRSVAN